MGGKRKYGEGQRGSQKPRVPWRYEWVLAGAGQVTAYVGPKGLGGLGKDGCRGYSSTSSSGNMVGS
jgi:hypothetical protein